MRQIITKFENFNFEFDESFLEGRFFIYYFNKKGETCQIFFNRETGIGQIMAYYNYDHHIYYKRRFPRRKAKLLEEYLKFTYK